MGEKKNDVRHRRRSATYVTSLVVFTLISRYKTVTLNFIPECYNALSSTGGNEDNVHLNVNLETKTNIMTFLLTPC